MSSRHPSALLCSLLLAAPLGAAPASAEEARAIVREALEQDGWDLTPFEDRLAALGAPVLEPLFALLVEGEVATEGAPLALGPTGEQLVLTTFERVPSEAFVQGLARLRAPLAPADARAAQLVLGAVADVGDLDLLVRLSTPAPAEAPVPLAAREGFTDAAWRILGRHRDESWVVSRHYDAAPPGLRAPLLAAVARAGMADEVGLFAGLLGVHPELDVLVLGQLARVATPWYEDETALEAVRGRLLADDERELRAAVLALTEFEDARAVDGLLAVMEDADPGLRRTVNTALVRITGRDFRGDVERWRAWRVETATWWRDEAQQLLRDVHGASAARAAAAVNELARHRMYRREVEAELTASLDPARPELCALVCAVLARVGSPRVLEPLRELEHAPDERVAAAAASALEIISARLRREFPESVGDIRR